MWKNASSIRVIRSIARVTFTEILKDKVLYGAFIICSALLALGALVSQISFLRPDRILTSFGLLALAVGSGALAILAGGVVLIREFERRTIFIALARPISRLEFLLGKYFGLSAVLFLNSFLLSAGFLVILRLASGPSFWPSSVLVSALGLLWVQSLVLAALALFFSSFSTSSLSIVMTFGMYLVGVNSSQLRLLATKQDSEVLKVFFEFVAAVIPNFEHFNLGFKVTYGLPVTSEFLSYSLFYALVWILMLLFSAGYLLEGKEN